VTLTAGEPSGSLEFQEPFMIEWPVMWESSSVMAKLDVQDAEGSVWVQVNVLGQAKDVY
jgi:hypothetical protein